MPSYNRLTGDNRIELYALNRHFPSKRSRDEICSILNLGASPSLILVCNPIRFSPVLACFCLLRRVLHFFSVLKTNLLSRFCVGSSIFGVMHISAAT